MQEIYNYIDEYVKLIYIVRRLNAKLHNLPEFLYSSSVTCNYKDLGLDDESISSLDENNNKHDLSNVYTSLLEKTNIMISEIYSKIHHLPLEQKEELYNYLLLKSVSLTSEASVVQNNYMRTVGLIEKAEISSDTESIRTLGRIAKEQYSKYYELESFKNSYTYLGCYISSMVSHKFEEDLNQGTGFGL